MSDKRPSDTPDTSDSVKRARHDQSQVAPAQECAEGAKCVRSWLREDFLIHDPVHGPLHLPLIARKVVDTPMFQRMRHIKQLGMCHMIFPGAVHTRFLHSLGVAFLAQKFVKTLQDKQPELEVSSRDLLCVTLAALCHDLGHPAYSHMFQDFVREHGKRRRKEMLAEALANGTDPTADRLAELLRYETWTHELGSLFLVEQLLQELALPLSEAGLKVDSEGDDFTFIKELIDPPKERLNGLHEKNLLHEGWADVMKGRPLRKAWLHEVVSNWRSGFDVDKFDYLRRDAHFLGIRREFDHERYFQCVRVVFDPMGLPTISPPSKERHMLRDGMLELRKMLHSTAYQHKATKKFELHMMDILAHLNEHVRITGTGGRRFSMAEAAVEVDPVAYLALTDTFVEAKLLGEEPELAQARLSYQWHIVQRHLMRNVGTWDLPRLADGSMRVDADDMIANVLDHYSVEARNLHPEVPVRFVRPEELRACTGEFHYGMGESDPLARILFRGKTNDLQSFARDEEAKTLRRRIFCLWNPSPVADLDDTVTLERLAHGFHAWALRVQSPASPGRSSGQSPSRANAHPRAKKLLRIQASCPLFD